MASNRSMCLQSQHANAYSSIILRILVVPACLAILLLSQKVTGLGTEYDCLVDNLAVGKADKKGVSQYGQDGIIEQIFTCIGTRSKKFVEFGAHPGESTSLRLIKQGWTGVRIDGMHNLPEENLFRHFVTAENAPSVLKEHSVNPGDHLDILVVDVDFNTFWIVASLLSAGYRPSVLVSEINRNFLPHQSYSVPYSANGSWSDSSCYFGASATAFQRLAKHFGYSLVALEKNGIDIFFVHNSIIGGEGVQTVADLAPYPSQQPTMWQPIHLDCPGRPWVYISEPVHIRRFDQRTVHLNHVPWRDVRLMVKAPPLGAANHTSLKARSSLSAHSLSQM